MSQTIINGIVVLAALVSILDYFGIKPKEPLWGVQMPLKANWKLAIMLALVAASLGMSGYGFYRAINPKAVQTFSQDIKHNLQPVTETIRDRAYLNETIEVDGKEFIHCKFTNVTFKYHGLGSVRLDGPTYDGTIAMATDNEAVRGFVNLLQGISNAPGVKVKGLFRWDENGNITPVQNTDQNPLTKNKR